MWLTPFVVKKASLHFLISSMCTKNGTLRFLGKWRLLSQGLSCRSPADQKGRGLWVRDWMVLVYSYRSLELDRFKHNLGVPGVNSPNSSSYWIILYIQRQDKMTFGPTFQALVFQLVQSLLAWGNLKGKWEHFLKNDRKAEIIQSMSTNVATFSDPLFWLATKRNSEGHAPKQKDTKTANKIDFATNPWWLTVSTD